MTVATTAGTARRAGLFVIAVVLVVVDLAVKAWAARALDGAPIDMGVVDLQLAFNSGAAFSFAADAPTWVLLTVTGLVTTGVAVVAWRTAPTSRLLWRIALAAILGGAVANVVDRAPDGVVTDYLHTGWWPTFNLADSFIVVGAATLVALTVFGRSHDGQQLSRAD